MSKCVFDSAGQYNYKCLFDSTGQYNYKCVFDSTGQYKVLQVLVWFHWPVQLQVLVWFHWPVQLQVLVWFHWPVQLQVLVRFHWPVQVLVWFCWPVQMLVWFLWPVQLQVLVWFLWPVQLQVRVWFCWPVQMLVWFLWPVQVLVWFCWPVQEAALTTLNTRKSGSRIWKDGVEWAGKHRLAHSRNIVTKLKTRDPVCIPAVLQGCYEGFLKFVFSVSCVIFWTSDWDNSKFLPSSLMHLLHCNVLWDNCFEMHQKMGPYLVCVDSWQVRVVEPARAGTGEVWLRGYAESAVSRHFWFCEVLVSDILLKVVLMVPATVTLLTVMVVMVSVCMWWCW